MYVREVGPKGFPQTFQQFMEANAALRDMIAEGRGKLEWDRKIPDEKLEELKALLSAADFKANMARSSSASTSCPGTCSETCPEATTRTTACTSWPKTMIEILPANLASFVEKKCGSLAGTPDFFDVIGQASWYEPEA